MKADELAGFNYFVWKLFTFQIRFISNKMFKTPISGILYGASKVSTKLFVPSSGLHATASMKLKESEYNSIIANCTINVCVSNTFILLKHLVHSNKVGNKLIIEGAYTSSPRKDYLIQNNGECCPLCNLGLDVKHTVYIL